jgi:hypothetical protein
MKSISLLFSLLLYFTSPESGGFQRLVFHDQQATVLGSHSFRLAGPDQPDKPTAWQGPLTITSGEKSCDADVSLVTAVYGSPESPYVIVITYSGSSSYVHFVTIASCAKQWNTYKFFTNGIHVRNDRLSILPACESPATDSASQCSSGRIYKLSNDAAPVLLKKESVQLTRKSLGVGFLGKAKVAHPKTSHAEILH